jgi:hypothetical protein
MVFLGPKGEELHGLRVVGFLGPAELLKRMEDAVAQSKGGLG